MRTMQSALKRHPELKPAPKSSRTLAQQFAPEPRNSLGALMRTMGPFNAVESGFAFSNSDSGGWAITDADAAIVSQRFTNFVRPVADAAMEPLKKALDEIRVNINPTNVAPAVQVGIPGVLVEPVIAKALETALQKLTDTLIAQIPGRYGRCGGMAFAGLDLYLAGWPVKGFGSTAPGDGPLRKYIFDRLLDSLDLNAGKFMHFSMVLHILPLISRAATAALGAVALSAGGPIGMAIGALIGSQVDLLKLGGQSPVRDMTRDHWNMLKQHLDAQAAWPIGLVYSDSANPIDQHQILALDYTDPGSGVVTLSVWDNNDRNQAQKWAIDFRGAGLAVSGAANARPVAAIICEEYSYKKPPDVLRLS